MYLHFFSLLVGALGSLEHEYASFYDFVPLEGPPNRTESDEFGGRTIADVDHDDAKRPFWLRQAVKAIPSGKIYDFWNYVHQKGDNFHDGKPEAFYYQHIREYVEEATRRKSLKARGATTVEPMHPVNKAGTCPEHMAGLEEWDYPNNKNVKIKNRKVILRRSVSVPHIEVVEGGVLVIGEPHATSKQADGTPGIEIQAWAIRVDDGGEFWVGSRSCRYQHEAKITLVQSATAVGGGLFKGLWFGAIGKKFFTCGDESVCEIHGKEKKKLDCVKRPSIEGQLTGWSTNNQLHGNGYNTS